MQIPRWLKILRSKKCEKLRYNLAEVLQIYFRVEVEGIENIPKKGPVIILPNHSGFAGFDAVVLGHTIKSQTQRDFRILAHQAYFQWSRLLRLTSLQLGLREAKFWSALASLRAGQVLILFPEGEQGNFKPTSLRYHLQEFHSGFLRLAMRTNAHIIPCLIIGAEESHLNLAKIDLSRWIDGLILPLPLNFFPLPAKWKIRFLKPIEIGSQDKKQLQDHRQLLKRTEDIRGAMQRALTMETQRRKFIYFPLPKRRSRFEILV